VVQHPWLTIAAFVGAFGVLRLVNFGDITRGLRRLILNSSPAAALPINTLAASLRNTAQTVERRGVDIEHIGAAAGAILLALRRARPIIIRVIFRR